MDKISISKVIPDEAQPRKYFDTEMMASLKSSIKRHGIINPLVVQKQGDKFLLIDGERRFRAAKDLDLKEVPIIVLATKDPISRLIEQFHIQEQHESWTPIEKAETILNLCEIMKISVDKVCEILSISKRHAHQYIAFAKLSDKEYFVKENTNLYHAEKIGEIKRIVRSLKEHDLEESFTPSEERKLEKVIVKKISDGEINSPRDYSRIKDSFKSNPKLIDHFLKEEGTISDMFVKSKAKGAYHLRNIINNSSYCVSHGTNYLANPSVKPTGIDIATFKRTIKVLQEIVSLVE